MRCSTLTLALLLLGVCAFAQQPLVANKRWGNVNVSVDVNQLWNYNRYEGSRWGIGGEVNTPLKSDRQKPILAQRKLFLSAYGGWGYRDHGWKYGAKAGLRLPQGLMQRDLFVEYKHDLTLSGKIGDKDYQLFALGSTPGFFSSHYVAFDRLRVGCISGLFEQHFGLDYRYSREHYLFSPDTLLYPLLHEADALNPYYYTTTFHALHFFLSPQRAAWSLTLDMGHFASKMESGYYAKLLRVGQETLQQSRRHGSTLPARWSRYAQRPLLPPLRPERHRLRPPLLRQHLHDREAQHLHGARLRPSQPDV